MATGPVLVVYASKHSSTAEIAERIAAAMRDAGCDAQARPAAEVDDLSGYGRSCSAAPSTPSAGSATPARFARRHAPALRADAGLALQQRAVRLGRRAPDRPDACGRRPSSPSSLGAREHVMFGGRVPTDPGNFVERAMLKNTPPERRDARDWRASRHGGAGWPSRSPRASSRLRAEVQAGAGHCGKPRSADGPTTEAIAARGGCGDVGECWQGQTISLTEPLSPLRTRPSSSSRRRTSRRTCTPAGCSSSTPCPAAARRHWRGCAGTSTAASTICRAIASGRRVRAETMRLKASHQAAGGRLLVDLAGLAPPVLHSVSPSRCSRRGCST